MPAATTDPTLDPRYLPAVQLIQRTGARQYQVRYSDEPLPVVWMAVAHYRQGWETAAAMDPVTATFRLCFEVLAGGTCRHCHRATGFDLDFGAMPLEDYICWYQWDPERATFRRGCE
jgi:hypothetical protein